MTEGDAALATAAGTTADGTNGRPGALVAAYLATALLVFIVPLMALSASVWLRQDSISAGTPPVDQIWFAMSVDPGSHQLQGQASTFIVGTKVYFRAHLSTAINGGEATIQLLLDGNPFTSLPLTGLQLGDVFDDSFHATHPGTWQVRIIGGDGGVLASGTFVAH